MAEIQLSLSGPNFGKHYAGLSTDTKTTTDLGDLSTWWETDTGIRYIWDGSAWQVDTTVGTPRGSIAEVMRAAAVLTLAEVAGTVIGIQNFNQMQLEVAFTLGSSSGCLIQVEFSDDGVTYYDQPSFSIINEQAVYFSNPIRLNVSASLAINFPIANAYCRIQAIAIDNATGTSLAVTSVKSNR